MKTKAPFKTPAPLTNEIYLKKLSRMKNLELIEEVSKFQHEEGVIEQLPLFRLVQGKLLFTHLAEHALSEELRRASIVYRGLYNLVLEQKAS